MEEKRKEREVAISKASGPCSEFSKGELQTSPPTGIVETDTFVIVFILLRSLPSPVQ